MIKYMVVTFDDVKNFQKFSYVDCHNHKTEAIKIPLIYTAYSNSCDVKESNIYILRYSDKPGKFARDGYAFIEDDTLCRIDGSDLDKEG